MGQIDYSTAPTEADVRQMLGKKLTAELLEVAPQCKWTMERWVDACEAAWMGLVMDDIAGAIGISPPTLYGWFARWPGLKPCLSQWKMRGGQLLISRLHTFAESDPQTTRWLAERLMRATLAPPVKESVVRQEPQPLEIHLVRPDAQGDEVPVPPEISGEDEEDDDDG